MPIPTPRIPTLTPICSWRRSKAPDSKGVQVLMNGMGGDLVIGGVLPELALLRQGRWGVLAQRLRRIWAA